MCASPPVTGSLLHAGHTQSLGISCHPSHSASSCRPYIERAQTLLCAPSDVLPPWRFQAAFSTARTGSADTHERVSRSCEKRKHWPHRTDEEMRRGAAKVKSFHWLLLPSLRHLSMISQSSVSSLWVAKGNMSLCPPSLVGSCLPIPMARGSGLGYCHPPYVCQGIASWEWHGRKIDAKCYSTIKTALLCWLGTGHTAVHDRIHLRGWFHLSFRCSSSFNMQILSFGVVWGRENQVS